MDKIFTQNDQEVKSNIAKIDYFLNTDKEYLSVDTETSGLDPFNDTLWSVQVGYKDEISVLFPFHAMSKESRQHLIEFLNDRPFIAHNAKFDYKFLKVNGVRCGDLHCTQVSERALYSGKYFTFDLASVLFRRFSVSMDKDIRKDFYDGTFQKRVDEFGAWEAWSKELIDYSLDDIEFLYETYYKQLQDAKRLDMEDVLWVENYIVNEIGDIELRGMAMHLKETAKFRDKILIKQDELLREVKEQLGKSWNKSWHKEYTRRMEVWNEWQVRHNDKKMQAKELRATAKFASTEEEKLDIRERANAITQSSLKDKPFTKAPDPHIEFNLRSPIKLRGALEELLEMPVPTTKADWLDERREVHPVIEKLVDERKFAKLAEFCEITKFVNKKTGRIHGNLHSHGTDSGRMSMSEPSLHQIPARTDEGAEFRGLFRPKKGYVYLQADYSALELVILAKGSGEKVLLDALQSGKDIHCFTMSKLMECDYNTLVALKKGNELDSDALEDFYEARNNFSERFNFPALHGLSSNKWVKQFRNYVKTITYGVAYRLTPMGAMNKFHCSYEDAENLINLFFDVYPNLDVFLRKLGKVGYANLVAVNPLGRRRWFTKPKLVPIDEIDDRTEKELLKKQKRRWESISDSDWDEEWEKQHEQAKREYKGKINYIKRQSANFYPQSINADILKLAVKYFHDDFEGTLEEGLVALVHDECIVEVKKEKAEDTAQILKECMQDAFTDILDLDTEVEVNIVEKWEK